MAIAVLHSISIYVLNTGGKMAKAKNHELVQWLDETIAKYNAGDMTEEQIVAIIENAITLPDGTNILSKKDAFVTTQILTRVTGKKFLQALYNLRLRAEGMYNI
jgi:hypothetical protein